MQTALNHSQIKHIVTRKANHRLTTEMAEIGHSGKKLLNLACCPPHLKALHF